MRHWGQENWGISSIVRIDTKGRVIWCFTPNILPLKESGFSTTLQWGWVGTPLGHASIGLLKEQNKQHREERPLWCGYLGVVYQGQLKTSLVRHSLFKVCFHLLRILLRNLIFFDLLPFSVRKILTVCQKLRGILDPPIKKTSYMEPLR